jgi:hypothetical protein
MDCISCQVLHNESHVDVPQTTRSSEPNITLGAAVEHVHA